MCAAGLLAVVLALPFTAKTLHLYHSIDCEAGDHAPHDCDTCPICCFTLSTFTEAFPADCTFAAPVAGRATVFPLREKIYSPLCIPYGLRAPPVA
jgi:hypothetical protein